MAIEMGLSTHEQEAIKLNGSEFGTNIDKLTIENQKKAAANGAKPPEIGEVFTNFIRKTIENTVESEVKKQNEIQE